MSPENLAMGILFLTQTGVGISGNFLLLFYYSFFVFTGKSLTLKDLLIQHLTFANFWVITSRGIPQTMAEFGMKYFLGDTGCKLILYLYRVARGISLYTTCCLSCFQAVTISSSNRWRTLKQRATKYFGPSCSLSWLVHPLLNMLISMRTVGPRNNKNSSKTFNFGYCSGFVTDTMATAIYALILCCTDGLCLGLMAWASGSMVSILYGHKRQVRYIHSAHRSPRVSPEPRATQTILLLVCTFVTFYALSSILLLHSAMFGNTNVWAMNVFTFIETRFPTLCPFVLISNSNSVSRLLSLLCEQVIFSEQCTSSSDVHSVMCWYIASFIR
ncbi:PREDICTED: vomeronasal type-1 receptor 4-like [Chinchilla lanigera]|uniref:vomeronasal type-1 receptor 4-like n=1 Tax=Chinchilla lanigera TaxID=34839 RepID=UPI00038F08BF|nr:PREDICTED: vomeronasal type-1 receptor 4-like [Chinchilla lanigera]